MVRVVIPSDVYLDLMKGAPSWHACLEGPIPLGGDEPFTCALDAIFEPTREAAHDRVMETARDICDRHSMLFDEDLWKVRHLVMVNCS